jgi:uncharacterized protein (TIGR00255 family)
MISSMTGFARREVAGSFGTFVCELRSVNHRFLDASIRLPDSCRSIEPELRAALARALRRGKVDCTIHHRSATTSVAGLDIDPVALERLLVRVRELAVAVPAAAVNIVELLRWPGVLRDDSDDPEAQHAAVRLLFAQTLEELSQGRAREGARLAELIVQRCGALAAMVTSLRAHLPQALERTRARFQERLRELGAQVDQERVEQEILLLLQRFDVAEELDRLAGHIEEARHALNADEPAGRRLDFLMQEFNREANTLSSKSQDLETTRTAVDMKVLIEQMREQVQNIE